MEIRNIYQQMSLVIIPAQVIGWLLTFMNISEDLENN